MPDMIRFPPAFRSSGGGPADGSFPNMSKWQWALVQTGILMSIFLVVANTTIVAPTLFPFSVEFDVLPGEVHWIVLAYNIPMIGLTSLMVSIAGVVGHYLLFSLAVISFVLSSAACGVLHALTPLIVLRTVQGIAASAIFGAGALLLTDVTPISRTYPNGVALPLIAVIAGTAGPMIGGALLERISWGWVYYLDCVLGILSLVVTMLSMPRKEQKRIHPRVALWQVDFFGHAMLLATTTLVIVPLQIIGTELINLKEPRYIVLLACLACSCACLATLLFWATCLAPQSCCGRPIALFPRRLFRHGVFTITIARAFFIGWVFYALVFRLPLRLQIDNELTTYHAGVTTAPILISAIFGLCIPLWAGRLRNRTGVMMILGSTSMLIGTAILTSLEDGLPNIAKVMPGRMFVGLIMCGFGFGILIPAAYSIVSVECSLWDYGYNQALVTQSFLLGGTLGLAVHHAALGDKVAELRLLRPAWSHSFFTSMVVSAIFSAVVLLLSLAAYYAWPCRYFWKDKLTSHSHQMVAWYFAHPQQLPAPVQPTDTADPQIELATLTPPEPTPLTPVHLRPESMVDLSPVSLPPLVVPPLKMVPRPAGAVPRRLEERDEEDSTGLVEVTGRLTPSDVEDDASDFGATGRRSPRRYI